MPSEMRVPRADLAGHLRNIDGARAVIAIVGAPGSGKSRLAKDLARDLNAATPGSAAILPMDGFHRDNDWLDQHGLRKVKGAPETFDIAGLSACLAAARLPGKDLPVPVFDRDRDQVIVQGAIVPAATRFVLVEGNYLLLTQPGWRDLFLHFDLSIRLHVPEPELRARLSRRWTKQSLPAAEIERRVETNDLPNGRLLRQHGRPADFVVTDFL
ncbi:hypothetical protein BFP70_08520 [Thioclava sp. SK-1]|nr:hypothetical protein BFP70_08520 [Thioclava sp. SK-1]